MIDMVKGYQEIQDGADPDTLAVKAIVLLLGALGLTGIGMAVFADVGVSVLAILNACRALRTK